MIQRIQSVFLLLVAIAMVLTLVFPLWSLPQLPGIEGSYELTAFKMDRFSGSGEINETVSKWYIGAIAAVVMILAIISIFQYKNRTRQMMFNMINSLLMVGLVAAVFLTTNGLVSTLEVQDSGTYQIGFWVILVAMVLNMLANRFIRKDEALVRSVDRIR
ncbi:DUF4293 domain-containing protein [Algoriphagus sediminis]|uniref:DUF4293 domain-containing protein n=1 Tax=Algoriphagus sediminis TaxID=3057113 RepID=A0ABT7Y9C1_9BACT|nr:DUF4293 domain-containing protein [Algoriphagus sediminis]MDN3203109.1 DUF4293 domain-containing protein [Algoriphagus sediminis]